MPTPDQIADARRVTGWPEGADIAAAIKPLNRRLTKRCQCGQGQQREWDERFTG